MGTVEEKAITKLNYELMLERVRQLEGGPEVVVEVLDFFVSHEEELRKDCTVGHDGYGKCGGAEKIVRLLVTGVAKFRETVDLKNVKVVLVKKSKGDSGGIVGKSVPKWVRGLAGGVQQVVLVDWHLWTFGKIDRLVLEIYRVLRGFDPDGSIVAPPIALFGDEIHMFGVTVAKEFEILETYVKLGRGSVTEAWVQGRLAVEE